MYIICKDKVHQNAVIKFLEALGYIDCKDYKCTHPNIFINKSNGHFCRSPGTEPELKLSDVQPWVDKLIFEDKELIVDNNGIIWGEYALSKKEVEAVIDYWKNPEKYVNKSFRLTYTSTLQRNAIVAYLEALGYKKSVNHDPLRERDNINMVINTLGHIEAGTMHDNIISLGDVKPFSPPLNISGHSVIRMSDGSLKVGCKRFPQELIEKIIKHFEKQ
jgi:hypothetical protein